MRSASEIDASNSKAGEIENDDKMKSLEGF